jgi:hypothetical protein
MQAAAAAKRVPTVPLILAVLLFAGLALVLESQLKLPIRLPGHRAFPGAMALVLLAGRAPRAMLLGFAAAVGIVIALVAQNPSLAVVWLVPAALLALAQPRSLAGRLVVALGAGLAFGLLRYLAMPGALHHTPEAVRLTGHLLFGALGSLGVARR